MSKLRRVIVAALALVMLAAMATLATLWHDGYRPYVVHTGSMEPNDNPGDLVIDRPASGSYHAGQVITFRHSALSDDVVTHRVVSVSAAGIQTKGDANPTKDAWTIRPSQVSGVAVLRIPWLGYLAVFLRQPPGVAALATVTIAIILLWGMFFPTAPTPAEAARRSRRRPNRARHAAA
jgi:signal peptidase